MDRWFFHSKLVSEAYLIAQEKYGLEYMLEKALIVESILLLTAVVSI